MKGTTKLYKIKNILFRFTTFCGLYKNTDVAYYLWVWFNYLFFQPDELTNALEISNIVFTSLFALEMLLKLLVYGPFGYIKNPYNIFDGIIVVIRYTRTFSTSKRALKLLHASLFIDVHFWKYMRAVCCITTVTARQNAAITAARWDICCLFNLMTVSCREKCYNFMSVYSQFLFFFDANDTETFQLSEDLARWTVVIGLCIC